MVLLSSDDFNAQWREQQAAASVPINNRLTKWRRPATVSLPSNSNPHRTKSCSSPPSQQTQHPHSLPTVSDSRPAPLSQQNQCPDSLLSLHNTEKQNCLPIPPKCKTNEDDLKSFTDKLTDIQLREAAALAELERLEKEAAAWEKKRLEEEAAASEKKRLEEEAAAAVLINSVNDEDKENAVLGKIAKKPRRENDVVLGKIAKKPRRENDELVVHVDGKILTVKNPPPPPPPCTPTKANVAAISNQEGLHRTHSDESRPYEYSTTLQDLIKRYASMIIVHQEKADPPYPRDDPEYDERCALLTQICSKVDGMAELSKASRFRNQVSFDDIQNSEAQLIDNIHKCAFEVFPSREEFAPRRRLHSLHPDLPQFFKTLQNVIDNGVDWVDIPLLVAKRSERRREILEDVYCAVLTELQMVSRIESYEFPSPEDIYDLDYPILKSHFIEMRSVLKKVSPTNQSLKEGAFLDHTVKPEFDLEQCKFANRSTEKAHEYTQRLMAHLQQSNVTDKNNHFKGVFHHFEKCDITYKRVYSWQACMHESFIELVLRPGGLRNISLDDIKQISDNLFHIADEEGTVYAKVSVKQVHEWRAICEEMMKDSSYSPDEKEFAKHLLEDIKEKGHDEYHAVWYIGETIRSLIEREGEKWPRLLNKFGVTKMFAIASTPYDESNFTRLLESICAGFAQKEIDPLKSFREMSCINRIHCGTTSYYHGTTELFDVVKFCKRNWKYYDQRVDTCHDEFVYNILGFIEHHRDEIASLHEVESASLYMPTVFELLRFCGHLVYSRGRGIFDEEQIPIADEDFWKNGKLVTKKGERFACWAHYLQANDKFLGGAATDGGNGLKSHQTMRANGTLMGGAATDGGNGFKSHQTSRANGTLMGGAATDGGNGLKNHQTMRANGTVMGGAATDGGRGFKNHQSRREKKREWAFTCYSYQRYAIRMCVPLLKFLAAKQSHFVEIAELVSNNLDMYALRNIIAYGYSGVYPNGRINEQVEDPFDICEALSEYTFLNVQDQHTSPRLSTSLKP
eukprot:scaffold27914_cov35-Cyclotella_meneghiniana.AAC.2